MVPPLISDTFLTSKTYIFVGKTKAYHELTVEMSENRTYPTQHIQA